MSPYQGEDKVQVYANIINSVQANLLFFFFYIVCASLIVRLVLSLMKASEKEPEDKFKTKFWQSFGGCGPKPHKIKDSHDHWQAFILGCLEIAIFSILIGFNKFEYIGAWLVLKTVPIWNKWQKQRNVYNRFLIGNVLVIISSFLLALQLF